MLFRTGWFQENKFERCLYVQESGILTAAATQNGKVICNCNVTVRAIKYDDVNETVRIPKRISYLKLNWCFHYFLMDEIGERDIVSIESGKHKGLLGEVTHIERTQYGMLFFVKFPGGCVCIHTF